MNINNNYYHGGRFGNLFFTAMAMHFIAKKNNLTVKYKDHDKFIRLGIDFFVGINTYENTIELLDNNFFNIILSDDPLYKNINISIENNVWCQTKEFSEMLMSYYKIDENRNKIISNNIVKNRYNNNNDVYIHVRLGDIINYNYIHPFAYYDNVLKTLKFDNGFISSDTIDHPICQDLIKKYNLHIINLDEVNTIMIASTCKYIVLSSGTFSWLIGLLSFYSKVYYPKIYTKWHGNIFVFDEWTEVDY